MLKIQTQYRSNNPKKRTDFKPTNVVRNRDLAPKKLNANSNIPKPANNSAPHINKNQKAYANEILRPFVEPTRSLRGRLELALGDITKQIKQSQTLNAQTLELLQSNAAQRKVKLLIRNRISKVMMNKVVKDPADIIVRYRRKYPKLVDEEILQAINTAAPKIVDKPGLVKPPTEESGSHIFHSILIRLKASHF